MGLEAKPSLPEWGAIDYGAGMNRIDRMFATILLLQSRPVIKAQDIAAHFEISLRTVYRDVAALSEAGERLPRRNRRRRRATARQATAAPS